MEWERVFWGNIIVTFAYNDRGTLNKSFKQFICLNLKTKDNLRKHEFLDMLRKLKYFIENVSGITEMKKKTFDVKSTTK